MFLGIPHPPGYPLYMLIGKIWMTVIPIGNVAFRMNMQSAFFASLAVMMVYLIILKLSISNYQLTITRMVPAVVASLIFAFSTTFWEQAVIAEKYTLNAFFFSLLIFILLKWQETQNSKLKTQNYLYLFAFILGLSFTHHFQTIYIVPGALFFLFSHGLTRIRSHRYISHRGHREHRGKNHSKILNAKFAICIVLFLLPLFLYAYLPIRASTHPPLNWGCPDTPARFVEHITAKSYQGNMGSFIPSLKSRFILHLNFFTSQFNIWFIPAGLFGFIFLLVKRPRFGVFLLLMAITNLLLAIRYDISNIEDYYLPSFLLFSILIGYFIHFLLFTLHSLLSRLIPNPYSLIPKTAPCLFFLFLPILQCNAHYYSSDHSDHYIAYDHSRNVLKYIRQRAVIFLEGDENFPCWYTHYIERQESDAVI